MFAIYDNNISLRLIMLIIIIIILYFIQIKHTDDFYSKSSLLLFRDSLKLCTSLLCVKFPVQVACLTLTTSPPTKPSGKKQSL